MSNVISMHFHRVKRGSKQEIIVLKNKYLFMDPIKRASARWHVAQQLALAPFSPYFLLLNKAYNEVDTNG